MSSLPNHFYLLVRQKDTAHPCMNTRLSLEFADDDLKSVEPAVAVRQPHFDESSVVDPVPSQQLQT